MPIEDGIVATSGARMYIGDKAWDYDTLAEFDGQTASGWTELAEVSNYNEFGKTWTTVKVNSVANRRTRKRKGSYDEGNLQLTFNRVPADDGQAKIIDARDDPTGSYPFKLVLDDNPGGAGGKPTRMYFYGMVMSYTTNLGGGEDVVRAASSIEINSDIVEGAATAGS
ncbi:hypothetical protein [Azospirillum sp. B4]|uniref:hypothetical protein n=1 Tax=Azospirillum sp. B4 TaxID=95605 RepID=UPI00034DAD3B|nr:hypothetical protein [Azospirillum sp. B4]